MRADRIPWHVWVPIGKATKVTHPVVAFGFSNERRMMHGDTRIYPPFFSLLFPSCVRAALLSAPTWYRELHFYRAYNIGA